MAVDKELLEILVCPETKAALIEDGDWLVSTDKLSRRRYPVQDGIPRMLVEESEAMEKGAWQAIMKAHGRADLLD